MTGCPYFFKAIEKIHAFFVDHLLLCIRIKIYLKIHLRIGVKKTDLPVIFTLHQFEHINIWASPFPSGELNPKPFALNFTPISSEFINRKMLAQALQSC